ncbi:MAG: hypothetical protein KDA91_04525 [Planctomycetaceae bacterium]|nr:hypothetical protein [Planctomycetaceae bacterium]
MRIGRKMTTALIAVYIGCLCLGILAHTMKVGLQGNTISYFFVWDMFCGWEAYDNRTRVVAEDVHGNFYDVRPPWGEFYPFGETPRVHYDVSNSLVPKYIDNVLSHTAHEEIDRVFVIQEIWPKQFNLPDDLWASYFEEPRDHMSYFNLRAICTEKGTVLNSYPDWFVAQTLNSVADNPRLQMAANRARPMYNTFINPARSAAAGRTAFEDASPTVSADGQYSTN